MDDSTFALAPVAERLDSVAHMNRGDAVLHGAGNWPGIDVALDAFERPLLVAEVERLRLENARLFQKSCQLEVGLRSSREIGAALGIVMTTFRVTNEQAFDILTKLSQHFDRKVREIAGDIVLTGALPEVPSKPSTSEATRTDDVGT